MPLRLTGVSSPTASACLASVASEDAIGSLVNVICLKDAWRAELFRPLPSSVVSSALAAAAADEGLALMYLIDSMFALSRSLTTLGFAFRKGCATTRLVVTNLPPGHRLASFTSSLPPSATISKADRKSTRLNSSHL